MKDLPRGVTGEVVTARGAAAGKPPKDEPRGGYEEGEITYFVYSYDELRWPGTVIAKIQRDDDGV